MKKWIPSVEPKSSIEANEASGGSNVGGCIGAGRNSNLTLKITTLTLALTLTRTTAEQKTKKKFRSINSRREENAKIKK